MNEDYLVLNRDEANAVEVVFRNHGIDVVGIEDVPMEIVKCIFHKLNKAFIDSLSEGKQ